MTKRGKRIISCNFYSVLLFAIFLIQAAIYYVVIQILQESEWFWVQQISYGTLFSTALTLWLFLSRYTAQDLNINQKEEQKSWSTSKIIDLGLMHCRLCESYVDQASIHCIDCEICILGYDHHCEFLNNCIGFRNFKAFIVWLLVILFKSALELFCIFNICLRMIQSMDSLIKELNYQYNIEGAEFLVSFTVILGLFSVIVFGYIMYLLGIFSYTRCQNLTFYQFIVKRKQRQAKIQDEVTFRQHKSVTNLTLSQSCDFNENSFQQQEPNF